MHQIWHQCFNSLDDAAFIQILFLLDLACYKIKWWLFLAGRGSMIKYPLDWEVPFYPRSNSTEISNNLPQHWWRYSHREIPFSVDSACSNIKITVIFKGPGRIKEFSNEITTKDSPPSIRIQLPRHPYISWAGDSFSGIWARLEHLAKISAGWQKRSSNGEMGDDRLNTCMKNRGGLPCTAVPEKQDIDVVDINAIFVNATAIR